MSEAATSSSLAPPPPPPVGTSEEDKDYGCLAEELADARLLSKREALTVIESLTHDFLQAISRGEDPELLLVSTQLTATVQSGLYQNHEM